MAIKVKQSGVYADIVGVFHKRAGAYEAVQGVFVKDAGLYGRVDAITDPNFANVSLLLHFEGANGGTTFTDNSLNGFTPTVTATARTATNQAKFGASSGEMFSGGKLSYADNAAFELGGGDFTIETFKRFSALPGSGVAVRIGAKFESVGNQRSYAFYQFNNAGTQQLMFSYSSDGIAATDVTENYTPPTGTWIHYAVTRSGNSLRFFINGTQVGTTKTVTATFFNGTAPYEIGTNSNGWFDDYRLTKGVARYTSDFTVPPVPFPDA